jgi:hypothetical protein
VTVITTSNTLVRNPAGRGRPVLRKGERFSVQGAFAATVVRSGDSARLRFRWTDRTPPGAPPDVAVERAELGTGLRIGWGAARERGSGLAHYDVLVDGKRRARVAARVNTLNRLSLARPSAGRHVVTVVAVDRAGNRSAGASRHFAVSR